MCLCHNCLFSETKNNKEYRKSEKVYCIANRKEMCSKECFFYEEEDINKNPQQELSKIMADIR